MEENRAEVVEIAEMEDAMAKAIMIQGTMSNAGKSLVAAGLCRIFKQDGYKVAPFKSQNMALNSYITKEGLEMGRAQVMQAQACGIEPEVAMNPILLKPTTDMGSQVIVNGEVLGNMNAMDYFKQKKKFIPDIMAAYQKLDKAYDIIVIEGAGSPAEINLKQEDIVNMGMAKMANAPVILVGDIDRGGVFAQLLGTIILLEQEEQDRIKGLFINKFRGDQQILEPGLRMLEDRCGKNVLGVIPYIMVDVDDEDSLSTRLDKRTNTGMIDIAVIKLPKISNFTDFTALETIPGFSVRYVTKTEELKLPDMIILPGTKSTMEDLRWLRESGLEALIKKEAEKGTLIWGICGGYQMLGETLKDPYEVEGYGTLHGMGLLPMETVFSREKKRTRVEGLVEDISGPYHMLSGKRLSGYEIHMGASTMLGQQKDFAAIVQIGGQQSFPDGMVKENICGTYIHGIFDTEEILMGLQQMLYQRKNLSLEKDVSYDVGDNITYQQYQEMQYDILADEIRKNIDMKKIYQIVEEGISE